MSDPADPSLSMSSLPNRFHERILEGSPIGHIFYDPVFDDDGELIDLQIRYFNSKAYILTGKSPLMAIGKRLFDIYPVGEQYLPVARQLFREGRMYREEHFFSPTRTWQLLTFTLFEGGVLETLEDITPAKKQSLLLRAVLDESIHPLALLTAERNAEKKVTGFRYALTNLVNARSLGMDPDDFIGKRWEELFPDIYETGFFDKALFTIESGDSQRFTLTTKLAERKQVTDVSLVRHEDGVLIQMVDISELTQNQQQLAWLASTLQSALDDFKEYSRVTAHDLQEPLRKINTMGELLLGEQAEELPPQIIHLITRMRDSARRLHQLVGDLQTYSSLSRRGRTFQSEIVDLDELFVDVLQEFKPLVTKSGAQIEYQKLPVVPGDLYSLRFLLSSILSNALKFHKPGEVPHVVIRSTEVENPVSVTGESRQGTYALITVNDYGIGIENQYRQQIFGLFKRLETTENTGTGLGLAVSKRVVEAHGGLIELESEVGKGTSVLVYLPLDTSAQ